MAMIGTAGGADPNIVAPNANAFSQGWNFPSVAYFKLSNDKNYHSGQRIWDGSTQWYDITPWCKAGGTAGDYDVRAMPMEGSDALGGSATGSWLNLATNREWTLTDDVPDGTPKSAGLILEFRKTSTGRIVAVGSAVMSASRNS